jgi:hypothetical protein
MINQYLQHLPSSRFNTPLHDINTIEHPKGIVKSIVHLRIHPGYTCLVPDCLYCVRTSKGIYLHSRQHHPSTMGHRAASLQRFFESKNSPYFEVLNPISLPPTIPSMSTDDRQQFQAFLEANRQAEVEDEAAFFKSHDDSSGKIETPWLKTTGFSSYLTGIDRRMLIGCTIIPHQHQLKELPVEAGIVKHLTVIFDRIQLATTKIPVDVLEWLNGDSASIPGSIPFSLVQQKKSWNRYVRYWIRLFIYLFSIFTSLQAGICCEVLEEKIQACTTEEIWSELEQIFKSLENPSLQTEEDLQALMEKCMLLFLQQR